MPAYAIGGGIAHLIKLKDTPAAYSGNAKKALVVNDTEDAVIFDKAMLPLDGTRMMTGDLDMNNHAIDDIDILKLYGFDAAINAYADSIVQLSNKAKTAVISLRLAYLDALTGITVGDGYMIQTDEVRARDGDGLKLYEDGGAGIFVKDGGKVGIGTGSPREKLEVSGGVIVDETLGWSQRPGNIYPDAGFEYGGQHIIFTGTYAVITDSAGAHTGNKYLRATGNSVIQDIYSAEYYQVQPGDVYYAEAWIKADAGTNGTAYTVFFEWRDKDKANPTWSSVGSTSNPGTSWVKKSGKTTVPSGKYYMRFGHSVRSDSTTGNWYWDDVYLYKVDKPGPLYVAGNVGIGTLNPQYGKLEVKPTINDSTTGITLWDGSGTTARSWLGTGDLWHLTRGTTATQGITMKSNGDIGIGTTTPGERLEVKGNIYANEGNYYIRDPTTGTKEAVISRATSGKHLHFGASWTGDGTEGCIYIGYDMDGTTRSIGLGDGATTTFVHTGNGLHVGGNADPGDNNLIVDGEAELGGALDMNNNHINEAALDLGDLDNQEYRGFVLTSQIAGESISFGNLIYHASDNRYNKADADTLSKTEGDLAIVLTTGTTAENGYVTILKLGSVKNTSWSMTIGAILYVSQTGGAITATEPSAVGSFSRKIGYAQAANIVYFDPSHTILENG